MKTQLNINTLVGGLSLAAICYFGKTVMETHDAAIKITANQDTMQHDVEGIKAQLPNFALKADVERNEQALWRRLDGTTATPAHGGQGM